MGYRTYGWVYLVVPAQFVLEPPEDVGEDANMLPSTNSELVIAPDLVSPVQSWRDYLSLWHREHSNTGSSQHADQHVARVEFFMEHNGLSSYQDIAVEHVISWKNELVENGQPSPNGRRRPCKSPSTIRTHVTTWASFYDWLVQIEAVVAGKNNPFRAVKLPKRVEHDFRSLDEQQIAALVIRPLSRAGVDRYPEQRGRATSVGRYG